MKRNIYSYSKLWMILFVLMGAACTNQVEDAIPVSGQPIGFSVQSDWKEIPNTRSNDKTQFIGGDEIQIFGFHKSSQWADENVQFMYQEGDPTTGQKVTYDNGNWNYSPKRFWPKKGVLDFFASYPYNSVHYDVGNKRMTYDNPLTQDLLYGLATNRDCASKKTVEIRMVHALAKVNINFEKSLGDKIGTVIVSAYKTGWFSQTLDGGIPDWHVDDKTIDATFGYEYLQKNNPVIFILPGKITRLRLFANFLPYDEIYDSDASKVIEQYKFEAGKEYNLTISKSNGVRKKNTNSRSIAMSVRCVSE